LEFSIDPGEVDERVPAGEEPGHLVLRLALDKATSVARRHPGAVVIGADTVVVLDGTVLGKPSDVDHARAMLRLLAGAAHRVLTGVAVVDAFSGRRRSEYEETLVWMRPYTEQEIERYLATGEPMGKAGAYAIQGRGALLVRRIEGCYANVVGMPLVLLASLLENFGVSIL
jgi:septum formation protein